MLQLTKRTEYGLIALLHLAEREGEVVSVREICAHYPIPRRLLAEVLKDLCRTNLVHSQRGATGGYALARPAAAISLGEVVSALEGVPSVTSCESLGLHQGGTCGIEPMCPIRSPLQRVRASLWTLLEKTSLRDMTRAAPAAAPAVHARSAAGAC